VGRQNSYSLEHIHFEGKLSNRGKFMPFIGAKNGRNLTGRFGCTADQQPLNEFAAWVLRSAGLPSEAYRAAPIHRRIAACMRMLKTGSSAEALRLLMQHPSLCEEVIDSLLIGSTEFTRDAPVFESLRNIIATVPVTPENPIRIWSAGCSTGAELYSTAMLLDEAGLLKSSILVGTDCRATAIRDAQAGRYPESSVHSMDASLRKKYMKHDGRQWRVAESLHSRIHWRVKNLLSGCEEGPWDIILWRNMSIYLNQRYALQVWEAMAKELRIGGLVVVGKAEKPPASTGLKCLSPCIYQLQRPVENASGDFIKAGASA
jgi:chemotaxis protein methyltransferase CheR